MPVMASWPTLGTHAGMGVAGSLSSSFALQSMTMSLRGHVSLTSVTLPSAPWETNRPSWRFFTKFIKLASPSMTAYVLP